MAGLNLFIDVGNGDKDLPKQENNTISLPAHIALVKNMEHVKSVFILADNNNKLQKEVTGLPDVVKEEYSETAVSFNSELAKYNDKIVVYSKDNTDLLTKMKDGKTLAFLDHKALMIQYSDVKDVHLILNLLTEKRPNISNIQLYPSGREGEEKNLKELNHIIKDAGELRGLKINLMNQGQVGGLFGLFKTKKWDELAADIVKKVEKKDKKYVDHAENVDIKKVEDAIKEYYSLDKLREDKKNPKKYYTAHANYESALTAVKSMLSEKMLLKNTVAAPIKMSSLKKQKNDGRNKTVDELKGEMQRKISSKIKARKTPSGKNAIFKKTSTEAELIISDKKFKEQFKDSTVPVIYYDNYSLPTLGKLLTAQFHESKSLREVFRLGKGTKKAGIISGVKKLYSKATRKNLDRVHDARNASEQRMLKKVSEQELKDYRRKSAIKEGMHKGKQISYNNPKVMELKTKKDELKKMGWALFKKTKKKQLQNNIAKLEKDIANEKKARAEKRKVEEAKASSKNKPTAKKPSSSSKDDPFSDAMP